MFRKTVLQIGLAQRAGLRLFSSDKNSSNMLKNVVMMNSTTRRIINSKSIYRNCSEQAMRSPFYENLDLERNFMNEFQLHTLHVWIVHRKLAVGKDKNESKLTQEEVYDAFWENTERRIRREGVKEIFLSSRLLELQKASFGASMLFDKGVKEAFENDGDCTELANSLSRVFMNERGVDESSVEFARYVLDELHHMYSWEDDIVHEGRFTWGLPPLTSQEQLQKEAKFLENPWRCAISVWGKPYWYNIKTNERVWDMPEGDNVPQTC